MNLSYISTFVSDALDRQVETLKNLTNWIKKTTINGEENQEVEDQIKEFNDKLNVQFGEGATLDLFAKIFDLVRTGQSDDLFRAEITNRYLELNGSGQIESMITAYKNLLDADSITLSEYQPATVIMNAKVIDPFALISSLVNTVINKIKVLGVRVELTVSEIESPFTFMSLGDSPNSALGFSSLASPSAGGTWGFLVPTDFVLTETQGQDSILVTGEDDEVILGIETV